MPLLPRSTKDLLLKRGQLPYVKFIMSLVFLLGMLLGVGLHLCRRETENERANITTEGLKEIPSRPFQLSSQEHAEIPLDPVPSISGIPLPPYLLPEQRTNLTIKERLELELHCQSFLNINNLRGLEDNTGLFKKLAEFPSHLFKPDSCLAKYEKLVKLSGDFLSIINATIEAHRNEGFTLSGPVKDSFSKVLSFVSSLEKDELYKELLCFFTEYNLKVESRIALFQLVDIIEKNSKLFDAVSEEVFSGYFSAIKEIKSDKEKAEDLESLYLLIGTKFATLKGFIENFEVYEVALSFISKDIEATEENILILDTFNCLFMNCPVAKEKQAVLIKIKEEKDRQEEEKRSREEEEKRKREEEEKRLADEQKRLEEERKQEEERRLAEEQKKLEEERSKQEEDRKLAEDEQKRREEEQKRVEEQEKLEAQKREDDTKKLEEPGKTKTEEPAEEGKTGSDTGKRAFAKKIRFPGKFWRGKTV
jgi:hypothetical protein